MPRTKVPPGSWSNFSCSSASSWRGANLSCCATSPTDRPRASRASRRAVPMLRAASVKFAPLQRLVFRRAGEAPPQLVGVALLGHALTQLALDAQREPERFGARRHLLVVARHE